MGISWASDQRYESVSSIPFHSIPSIHYVQADLQKFLVSTKANPFFCILEDSRRNWKEFLCAPIQPFKVEPNC